MKKKSLTRIFQFALAVTSCFYIFRSEVEASYTGDSAKKIDTPTTLHNSATVKEEFLKKFTDKLDSKEIESIFSSDDLQTIKANIMAFADAQKKLVERTSSVKPTSKRKKKSFGQVNRTLLALATDLYNFAEMLDTSSQKQTKELTEKKSLHADYLDDGDD
ncbi:MAG: hypothetical protein LBD81_02915, partial [Holosporaceae bacterium]|nr:hypothetical protein [Holosporaceae bacterium]